MEAWWNVIGKVLEEGNRGKHNKGDEEEDEEEDEDEEEEDNLFTKFFPQNIRVF